MIIIGVVGSIGAGKDAVSSYLEEEHGFEVIKMGDLIRKIARSSGLEPTRRNLNRTETRVRNEHGRDYLARRAAEIIESSPTRKFVINGIRPLVEVETLRERFGEEFTLLQVCAKDRIRFKRLKERGRPGDPETYEEFRGQDKKEFEKFNLENTFEKADYIINNNGTLEELHQKVEELLKKV